MTVEMFYQLLREGRSRERKATSILRALLVKLVKYKNMSSYMASQLKQKHLKFTNRELKIMINRPR
jgi:hypothetical protein